MVNQYDRVEKVELLFILKSNPITSSNIFQKYDDFSTGSGVERTSENSPWSTMGISIESTSHANSTQPETDCNSRIDKLKSAVQDLMCCC